MILSPVNDYLSARSRLLIGAVSLILLALIGALDYLTGYELSFSVFYLLPIAISSWYAGRHAGYVICVISATTWLVIDYNSNLHYTHPAILYWNAVIRLIFFIIVANLLGRLRLALENQVSLAQIDGLTGIMNAITFRKRCLSLLHLAARHGKPSVIGYIDLDDFKQINDSHGHHMGDRVLKAVANTLMQRMRASDLVGRLGGDEFAIMLPETDAAGARTFFNGLQENLLDLAARNRWPIGFSIGVAVFNSLPENLEDTIRYADELMYKVKTTGKNNILLEKYRGASSLKGQTELTPPST